MARGDLSEKINELFEREEWEKARKLLEREIAKDPLHRTLGAHWLLTQLAETYYEQRKYREALQPLLASLKIMDDCPLTLWHLAGTLDALGKHADAIKIYTWLLECDRSPDEYPCWESEQWTDALKTDCVYRLGVCFENLGRPKRAEEWYRKYLDLLLIGAKGQYSIDDVTRDIRGLSSSVGERSNGDAVRKALGVAPRGAGAKRRKHQRRPPPRFDQRGRLIPQREEDAARARRPQSREAGQRVR